MQIFDIVLLPVGEQIVRERCSPIICDTYFSSKLVLLAINDRTLYIYIYIGSLSRVGKSKTKRTYRADIPRAGSISPFIEPWTLLLRRFQAFTRVRLKLLRKATSKEFSLLSCCRYKYLIMTGLRILKEI